IVITALSMLVGIIVISPLVGASVIHSGVIRDKDQRMLRSLFSLRFVALAGLSSGIAVIALYFAVQRADVVVVSPIVSSSPLVTLFLSHLFLSRLEQVTPQLVAGTLLAIVGVILVVLGR
ncbi:MAG: EamA family transporter, partial [Chloroflexota bacterium]|nr:EamA family transporter [Chloroflexota bacterium]